MGDKEKRSMGLLELLEALKADIALWDEGQDGDDLTSALNGIHTILMELVGEKR